MAVAMHDAMHARVQLCGTVEAIAPQSTRLAQLTAPTFSDRSNQASIGAAVSRATSSRTNAACGVRNRSGRR